MTESLPVRLHPRAEDDVSAAYSWYLERNPIIAEIFFVVLNSAMDRIASERDTHAYRERQFGGRSRDDAMRFKGTIAEWNDDRGFGFIRPTEGGDRVFCHIKAFEERSKRPSVPTSQPACGLAKATAR